MERATGRSLQEIQSHNYMWSSHTHVVTIIRSLLFSHSHTLTRIYNNKNSTQHTLICMHVCAFSRSCMLNDCWCVYAPFNFCLHSLMAWLRPILDSSMDFYGRLCTYLSLSVPSCNQRLYVVPRFGRFLWFILDCVSLSLEILMLFFHIMPLYYSFQVRGIGDDDSSFSHKIDNLDGILMLQISLIWFQPDEYKTIFSLLKLNSTIFSSLHFLGHPLFKLINFWNFFLSLLGTLPFKVNDETGRKRFRFGFFLWLRFVSEF